MKKGISSIWIILIVVIILIVLAGGYFLFFYKSLSCAKEGQQMRDDGPNGYFSPRCCEGLNPMYNVGFKGNCSAPSLPGDIAICSNCGNGICNSETNEDKCNCPEDCAAKLECVGEGETFGGWTAELDYCCEGLNSTYQGYFAGDDGKCIVGADFESMCTKCGNGVCGSGENKCNCYADCTEDWLLIK